MSEMKETFFSEFGPDSDARKALMEFNESGQGAVIQYTWVFTHELAMLVNAGEAFYLWGTGQEDHNDA